MHIKRYGFNLQCPLSYRGRCVPRPGAISEFLRSSDTPFILWILSAAGREIRMLYSAGGRDGVINPRLKIAKIIKR